MRAAYQPDPSQLDEINYYIGARLREARRARNWSLKALSGQLNPPMTWQQLQKYETGKNRLASCRLWEVARLFGLPVQHFFP